MQCAQTDSAPLPATLPAMILPGIALFPHSLLPLFIFEQRYCEMLESALESDRHFCVAMPRDPDCSPASIADIHPAGGVGVIRACVRNDDGTSNLLLQGRARVRFTSIDLSESYPRLGVQPIAPTSSDPTALHILRDRTVELVARAREKDLPITPQIEDCLRSLKDPEAVADLVAATIVADQLERLRLLEEPDTAKRLARISNYLEKALAES